MAMTQRLLPISIFAALMAVIPFIPGMPPFWIVLLNNIGLAALVAMGLVILTGVGGLTSFGQAAFCGFGAYTTAVLTTAYGVSPWLTPRSNRSTCAGIWANRGSSASFMISRRATSASRWHSTAA